MSFWDLEDGTKANENTKTEYEMPGGSMEPIPNNSDVLAEIKEAKWDTAYKGTEKFISIQWKVAAPDAVKNRVVFQKLWVADLDPNAKSQDKAKEKRDKARRMLATIDANAGGKLAMSTEAPTDDSLALALQGKQMVTKVMVWDMPRSDGPGRNVGNWISAVKPKDSELFVSQEPLPDTGVVSTGSSQTGGAASDIDDEIPF